MTSKTKGQIISAINRLEDDHTTPVIMFWVAEDGKPAVYLSGTSVGQISAIHHLLGTALRQIAPEAVQGNSEDPQLN